VLTVSGTVPAWLLNLAEAVAGVRYGPDATAEPLDKEAFQQVRKNLLESPEDTELSNWAKRFVSNVGTNSTK
jgi:hypothetical protein